MEGHNTHGGVAIGAAYAVKQAMQRYNIPGSVAIRSALLRNSSSAGLTWCALGYYKDADIAVLLHIGDNFATGYGLATYAAISAKFTFHGKNAHGAIESVGRQGRSGRRRTDGHRLRQAARTSATDLSGSPCHHDRRHPA